MGKVLVVSGSQTSRGHLVDLLAGEGGAEIVEADTGEAARRCLEQEQPDILVINMPLPDEKGDALALQAIDSTFAGVLCLVKEGQEPVAARLEEAGALVLRKPVNRPAFQQAMRLAAASRRRMLGLKTENAKLQNKIVEIRLVDRAKCVLIQYLGLTEPQAHRYIEKQAMERRVSRREVAESLLKTYEN